jgi:transposase
VATRFDVGIATVVRWMKRVEPQCIRSRPPTKIDRMALARDVREYSDAYQAERAQRLGVSEKGIGHALRRMNISYKKLCNILARTSAHSLYFVKKLSLT